MRRSFILALILAATAALIGACGGTPNVNNATPKPAVTVASPTPSTAPIASPSPSGSPVKGGTPLPKASTTPAGKHTPEGIKSNRSQDMVQEK